MHQINDIYNILYKQNELYRHVNFNYKFYYSNDGSLNLLTLDHRIDIYSIDKLTKLTNRLDFIKNNPFTDLYS